MQAGCAGAAAGSSLVAGSAPLAYCTFGAAATEVELDVLTGEQRTLRADILFDCGRSMNPALDMGQARALLPAMRG
jgi:xanthine dehydrogenase molybdopterin-binding subunit B